MDGSIVIMEGSSLCDFVTPMDGSLVIMEGSPLLRFCYSNGWYHCNYGRMFVVEILLLQWMVKEFDILTALWQGFFFSPCLCEKNEII